MVRIYKSRKKIRVRKKNTRKKKVFRRRNKKTKKGNNRRKKRNNKRKKGKKGGSVRRRRLARPAAAGTRRVANKWVAPPYGDWFAKPNFIKWRNPDAIPVALGGDGTGYQYGTTSLAVKFLQLAGNAATPRGKVHLYGTSLPQQHNEDRDLYTARAAGASWTRLGLGKPWVGTNTDSIHDPTNWGGANGMPVGSRMYRHMAYFAYAKGVKRWITHQACAVAGAWPSHFHSGTCRGTPNPGRLIADVDVASKYTAGIAAGRHPWDALRAPYNDYTGQNSVQRRQAAEAEDRTWQAIRNRYPGGNPGEPHGPGLAIDPNWYPVFNYLIQDMTVGRLSTWDQINTHHSFGHPDNSTVLHCYAGWGRTGCSLFFYILRNWFSHPLVDVAATLTKKKRINRKRFGFADSLKLYDEMRKLMNMSLEHDDAHIDAGTTYGDMPRRITQGMPLDLHAGRPGPPNFTAAIAALPPAQRPPVGDIIGNRWMGDWQRFRGELGGETPHDTGRQGRTSDVVHEMFVLRHRGAGVGAGWNYSSDIFIGRFNTIIVSIWMYLYLTDFPNSIAVGDRDTNHLNSEFWEAVWLYRKPSGPQRAIVGPPATAARPAPAWIYQPNGRGTDRSTPRHIFGHQSRERIHLGDLCALAGWGIGGLDGHITKAPPAPANAMTRADLLAIFGIEV